MQISEMRTFYNLHYHKRVLRLIINSNLFSSPNASLSKSAKIRCISPQYHSLGRRYIHSSNRLSSNVPDDENPRVWASFDPVTNDVTTSVVGGSEGLRCDSESGDEKVGALSGLGSFVEGKASEEEESERIPQSWATVYRKRSGGAGCNTDSTTRAVWGSQSLRSESDSGDEKFEASSGLGSFREGSIQERGSGADENFEEDESGMTPKSWLNAYSKGSGGTEAIMTTVGESESLRYESDSGNEKLGNLLGIGSFVESSVPDKGGSVVKKKSDKELSGGRGGDRASPKSGDHLSMGMSVSKNKKGKTKTYWVCSGCGKEFGKWWGSCTSCGEELKEFLEPENVDGKTTGYSVTDKVVGSWFHQKAGELFPQRVTDVNKGINQLTWKIPLSGLFGAEVGRVLGGGLVPGCLVLVGGDPGVGKSTLLLQIAAMIAEGDGSGRPAPVVYVSGEESVEQIANRADRMRIGTEDLFLYSGTDIEDILEKIHALSPRALIVDSIQTVYLKGVAGSAGGMVQVKECTQSLLRFAKKTNIPVLLIGHVTKAGDLAGPRVLEHIVDVVLYMEGEKYSAHRFLRSVKNRFGSTDELGVFEMSQDGLQAVPNPSDIFLSEQHSDSEILVGLAVAVIIDGSRSFLLEIQALCLPDTLVPRQFNGVQKKRSEMIISVLTKQAGLMLQNNAIFVNVVSGVNLQETAGDLAIAAAICSSFLEFPIPNDIAFIGEIGLAGELRPVPRMEKRVNAVAKLGYRKCIVPKSAEKQLATLDSSGMIILGCKNLKEVINNVFQS